MGWPACATAPSPQPPLQMFTDTPWQLSQEIYTPDAEEPVRTSINGEQAVVPPATSAGWPGQLPWAAVTLPGTGIMQQATQRKARSIWQQRRGTACAAPTAARAVHYTLRLHHAHLGHCFAAAITSWECFNAGSDSPELAGGDAPRGQHALGTGMSIMQP